MVDGESVARRAGDQDRSRHWSAYGVSHHSLRWDLLCQPVRPSVACRNTTGIHELVGGFNQGATSLLVEVLAGAGAEAVALDDPGEAGGLVSHLGDVHVVWLLLEHVVEHSEATRLPVLLQARVPVGVHDLNIIFCILVFSFLGPVRGSQGSWLHFLHPTGGKFANKAVQGLSVNVPHQSIKIGQRRVPTKLALRQIVQELLGQPVDNPQSPVVAGPTFIPIVQSKSQEEV